MNLTLESVKRMNTTAAIYHHLDCQYGGSKEPELKHEYCRGYINATFNHNLITTEVRQILNKWNDSKLKEVNKGERTR